MWSRSSLFWTRSWCIRVCRNKTSLERENQNVTLPIEVSSAPSWAPLVLQESS
ncbi:unnamed protein product, partial [Nesidiocoris tenuis]